MPQKNSREKVNEKYIKYLAYNRYMATKKVSERSYLHENARPEVNRKIYDEVMIYGMEQAIKGKMSFPNFESVVVYLLKVAKK